MKMLNTQYRMHPSISTFPSSQFYGGGLLDGQVDMRACATHTPQAGHSIHLRSCIRYLGKQTALSFSFLSAGAHTSTNHGFKTKSCWSDAICKQVNLGGRNPGGWGQRFQGALQESLGHYNRIVCFRSLGSAKLMGTLVGGIDNRGVWCKVTNIHETHPSEPLYRCVQANCQQMTPIMELVHCDWNKYANKNCNALGKV